MIKNDFQNLDSGLFNYYNRNFREKTKFLTRKVLDSPTQYTDVFQHWDLTDLQVKSNNFRVLCGLAIMSWYMTEEVGILLRLSLEEKDWPAEKFLAKELLLTSKDVMIGFLILQDYWNSNDLFGNILRRASSFWNSDEVVDFRKIPQSHVEKYTGYCRGYQESNRGGSVLPLSLQPVEVEEADVLVWEAIKISQLNYWVREIRFLLCQYDRLVLDEQVKLS